MMTTAIILICESVTVCGSPLSATNICFLFLTLEIYTLFLHLVDHMDGYEGLIKSATLI